MPPSTTSSAPATKLDSSHARKSTAAAISLGSAVRPTGIWAATWAMTAASPAKILPALKYKLNEQTLMQVEGGAPGAVTRGDVNIMADKGIPFHVLKKVMATCSDARFAKISLAVIEKHGSAFDDGGGDAAPAAAAPGGGA